MGYTEKNYVCVCPADFRGENCEGKTCSGNFSTTLYLLKRETMQEDPPGRQWSVAEKAINF